MPVPGFLSSFADKAQSAINATPLAGHIPHTSPPPPADQAHPLPPSSSYKSHALESLQHQIRTFGQQYIATSTLPVQRIITVQKGVALSFDALSRDSKAQSKELYTWGQGEDADLKDVSDRLAYLNFVQGSLAGTLANKLDAARTPFKALRDAENALAPRRAARQGLQNQIARTEHDQLKGSEQRLAELKQQLSRAEAADEQPEKDVELLKRKALRESELAKWDAMREYGEKIVLLSQASKSIIGALPTLPPSPSSPYTAAPSTAAARASLQRALDNYKTGHINLPPPSPSPSSHGGGSDIDGDTRSFGESHANELDSLASESDHTQPGIPLTPPPPQPRSVSGTEQGGSAEDAERTRSPPINPSALNNAPALLPAPIPSSSPSAFPSAPGLVDTSSSSSAPAQTTSPLTIPPQPTIAETGVPLSASSASGPGPKSGSLKDVRGAREDAGVRSGGGYGGYGQTPSPQAATTEAAHPTAEEEKARLERAERERVASSSANESAPTTATPGYETAEEEKKRLEKEERERVLAGGGANQNVSANEGEGAKKEDEDEELPAYQEM
ncbi:hypothetical protein SERLADRAFT_453364 [Serpula lacrymans var. lacrymans S7.9]|uniref:Sphingolipid long chain base-responsive protein LSP1 n=1 Tax=Serpula lacrymans var. lacrymans (strain S7.9) TaxID=578457 RepID=F8PA71_SERL9|nr:uncharacterized protein SERLADRAFT_453364 [Serpula lacrymans var. lacrymans S7.9]EGO20068.1 hypothetical protein SERLADRAFT_453364 [Serpula lacrymans var. lacrymans S7.9]